jgi:cytochrome c oxidase subunit 3
VTRIKAECKAAPKPSDPGDLFADQPQHLELGKSAIHPRHELTAHEQHEIEAAGPPPEHTNMFFTIYFAMTGLHGIHVIFGIAVFTWLLIRAIKGQFTPDYFGPVDYAALYWHIVDLIWIFLFPLLYLIH